MSARQPYPGLRPFEPGEADIFFGREEQTDELLRRLDHTRFLAVTGPSGCGKSSLVRAGMMAALKAGFMARAGWRWRMALMRPGWNPMGHLAASLLEVLSVDSAERDQPETQAFFGATLRRGPLGLVELLRERPLPEQTNLLLVADQFEEIFRFRAQQTGAEAEAFVSLLLESAAQREAPVYVVLTMRSDYLGDCAVFSGLPEALNRSQYLTPRLTREQRRAAIVGPARVFEGDVEPALVNRLLNESGEEPDQLPVLQHVLLRMWMRAGAKDSTGSAGASCPETPEEPEAPPPGRRLIVDHYTDVGRLEHALSNHADEAYNELGQELGEPGQKIAEIMFRRLSERGQDQREVRRPTALAEITALARAGSSEFTADRVEQAANVFREARYGFIVPRCPEPLRPESVLDITHESLIRLWGRLNEWAKAEAASADTYGRLEETARLWEAGRAALWGTPDLEHALEWKERERPSPEWARRYGGDFPLAMRFLEESQRYRQQQLEQAEAQRLRELEHARLLAESERRRAEQAQRLAESEQHRAEQQALSARRLRCTVVVLAVVCLALAVAMGLFQRARMHARSRELAATAVLHLDLDPEISAWLALHALGARSTAEAEEALQRAVQTAHARLTLPGHPGGAYSVKFGSDGRTLASCGEDGAVRLWDARSGKLIKGKGPYTDPGLEDGRKGVYDVAISPGDEWLASAGITGTVVLRNLRTGERRDLQPAHDWGATAVAFAPDGRLLASAGWDGKVRLWRPSTGGLLRTIEAHEKGVRGLAFSHHGKWLATSGADNHARIWDAASGKKLKEFEGHSLEVAAIVKGLAMRARVVSPQMGHEGQVAGVDFAADDDYLLTGSEDRTWKLWKIDDAALVNTGAIHASGLSSVAFSRDGYRMATGSNDMTARIWDFVNGLELLTLPGHTSFVNRVAFSPDDRSLATASSDGTVKVWDVAPGHTDQVYDVAFTRDGKHLVSTGRDWTLRLWRMPSGQPEDKGVLRGHYAPVNSVAFHPKGDLIASGGEDRRVLVWSRSQAKRLQDLDDDKGGHSDRVNAVTFSPRGDLLASVGNDVMALLWDLNGRLLHRLSHNHVVTGAAFHPDGKTLVTSTLIPPELLFWDTDTGKPAPRQPLRLRKGATGIAISPNGQWLAVASQLEDEAHVLNWASGKERFALPHSAPVADVDFSEDSSRIVTASWDRTAKIWDAASGRLLHTFTHTQAVNAAVFSPDGRHLVTACDDKRVHIYPLDVSDLRLVAKSRITRPVTAAECKKYLQTDSCPPLPE